MIAIAKNIRISPRKVNLVADMIQGEKALIASERLGRMPKKAAALIKKVLDSAIANAKNNDNQDVENLVIVRVLGLKAPTLKRFRPISKGRAAPLLKRSSHIRVELAVA